MVGLVREKLASSSSSTSSEKDVDTETEEWMDGVIESVTEETGMKRSGVVKVLRHALTGRKVSLAPPALDDDSRFITGGNRMLMVPWDIHAPLRLDGDGLRLIERTSDPERHGCTGQGRVYRAVGGCRGLVGGGEIAMRERIDDVLVM